MEQQLARQRARQISEETGDIAVADTVRRLPSSQLQRGGWPHPDQTWAVFDYATGHLIEMDPPEPTPPSTSET